KTSKKPVDQIMPTFVKQAGVPIIDVKSHCSGNSTAVTVEQHRYYYDREKFQAPNDELWQVPLCMKSSTGAQKCELLTKKQGTFTLPACSTWVVANAGATGYYRAGYEPNAVRALASDAESKLSAAERIALLSDIWASVRVGREPVGDYLAFAEGLGTDRDRAVLEDLVRQLSYIGRYLVTDSDRESYRAWLRQFLTPILKDVGEEAKAGGSDEQKALRAVLFRTLGYDARDPQVLGEAEKVTDKAFQDPTSVDRELAMSAFGVEALKGDQTFYDKLMAALKTPKSPEEYYMILFTLPHFADPKLLQRTLDYAISPDVRSQDALGLIAGVMGNPAGQKLGWDFVRQHWPAIEKSGGPFASADVIGATASFCDATMRDEVAGFYSAHKIEAAERTYRQAIERINNCVDLKSQQEPHLASWLERHGSTAGGQ
ncbi:MAG TPA: ERAP1-like C-terminal domain-containing protein, partial [Bryobacteraceae bacterium]|nr:ERAP1-like C-terminal domain-containing protein [Bryobacteraceae bacterium]